MKCENKFQLGKFSHHHFQQQLMNEQQLSLKQINSIARMHVAGVR